MRSGKEKCIQFFTLALFIFVACNAEPFKYDSKYFVFDSLKYFPNKEKVSDSLFTSTLDKKISLVKSYYSDGTLSGETFFYDGKPHGQSKGYANGKVFAIIEYEHGKKISEKIIEK